VSSKTRMSVKEFLDKSKKHKLKMGNQFKKVDGITFQSKKEANFYKCLLTLRRVGDIRRIHRQVIFDLPGGTTYRVDFMIIKPDGCIKYVDVKGHRTAMFIMKKKQVEALYKIVIEEA